MKREHFIFVDVYTIVRSSTNGLPTSRYIRKRTCTSTLNLITNLIEDDKLITDWNLLAKLSVSLNENVKNFSQGHKITDTWENLSLT